MTAFQWLTSYLRLTGAKSSGRNWQCPSHEDSYPSLSISATELGHVLLHCHGGCTWERVMDSLGLNPSLLFEPHSLEPDEVFCQNSIKPSFPKLTRGNHFHKSDRRVDFHIVYHEYTTEVRLSRIRYLTGEKRCLWQIKEGGHWRNSREGDLDLSTLPLYNEIEVIRGGFLNEVIVVCESESSVDALTGRGIYATTWAGGASCSSYGFKEDNFANRSKFKYWFKQQVNADFWKRFRNIWDNPDENSTLRTRKHYACCYKSRFEHRR